MQVVLAGPAVGGTEYAMQRKLRGYWEGIMEEERERYRDRKRGEEERKEGKGERDRMLLPRKKDRERERGRRPRPACLSGQRETGSVQSMSLKGTRYLLW